MSECQPKIHKRPTSEDRVIVPLSPEIYEGLRKAMEDAGVEWEEHEWMMMPIDKLRFTKGIVG